MMRNYETELQMAQQFSETRQYRQCIFYCGKMIHLFMGELFHERFGGTVATDPVVQEHLSSCRKDSVDLLLPEDLVALCEKKGILPMCPGPQRRVQIYASDLGLAVRIYERTERYAAVIQDMDVKDDASMIVDILSRLVAAGKAPLSAVIASPPPLPAVPFTLSATPSGVSPVPGVAEARKPRRSIAGGRVRMEVRRPEGTRADHPSADGLKRGAPARTMTQNDLVPHLLSVLARHGGRVKQARAVEEIFEFFKDLFQEPFYQEPIATGVPRWRHYILMAKEITRERGLIKSPQDAGRGFFELSEKGFKAVKQSPRRI